MGEYGPSAILGIFRTVDAAHPKVQNGGIIGDRRHFGGYHRSRNVLRAAGRSGDYSIQADLDRTGDGDAAAGLDLTCPPAEMKLLTKRLVDATRARDPRLVGKLRDFGGTLDGRRVTAVRVADQKAIPFDSSHLWHVHLSIHRKWVNDVNVCQGIAAVLCGVPLPSDDGKPKAPTTRDVYLDKLEPGQQDSDSVWRIQDALQKLGYDVDRTRNYDAKTVAAVKAYQTKIGDDFRDGNIGPLQTAKLFTDAGIKVNIEAQS